MNKKLTDIAGLRTRVKLHLGSVFALFFLYIYNRMVCPFIESIGPAEFTLNISGILVLQLVLREVFYKLFTSPSPNISLPRKGYYISISTWLIAGAAAMILHAVRYPDFMFGSHIKLLTSYWVLGAGVLSQWEYVLLEKADRNYSRGNTVPITFLERITRRVMEGYIIFTLAPAAFMLLVVARQAAEGYMEKGAAAEVAYIALFCLLSAITVAVHFGKTLKEDTSNIVKGLKSIEDGNLETILDIGRPDELGEMTKSINQMVTGLKTKERIKEAFGRFVTPEVATEFIEKYIKNDEELVLGGHKRDAVIMMCDIRNFTPLAEGLSPEDLVSLLNRYFGAMVQAIQQYSGIVDKFIGDEVMAVFGMVSGKSAGALDACRAAIQMEKNLAEFNKENEAAGQPILQFGIGIHTGEVVAGYIGSPDRLEFTVIGSAVNVAARIESQAKSPNPPVLFSKEINSLVSEVIDTGLICKAKLKGVSEEMELYSFE